MRAILRSAFVAFALAAFALAATGASAQSKEPMVGSWKLNVEKSKYTPGPAPKSSIVKIEQAGDGVKYWQETVNAEGKSVITEFTAKYDGKDYPLKGSPTADTVTLRKIDNLKGERVDKKDGKPVVTVTRVLSKDGKSFTSTVKGTNAKGEPYNNVVVYERM
jgi:hypothetical protein